MGKRKRGVTPEEVKELQDALSVGNAPQYTTVTSGALTVEALEDAFQTSLSNFGAPTQVIWPSTSLRLWKSLYDPLYALEPKSKGEKRTVAYLKTMRNLGFLKEEAIEATVKDFKGYNKRVRKEIRRRKNREV